MSELRAVIRQIEEARRDLFGAMPDRIVVPRDQLERMVDEAVRLYGWSRPVHGVRVKGVAVVASDVSDGWVLKDV